jgi:hypothetical protein
MPIEQLVVVYGGELAKDVAKQLEAKKELTESLVQGVTIRCADDRPKSLVEFGADTLVCFILQTIENSAPTEDVSVSNDTRCYIVRVVSRRCVRFSSTRAAYNTGWSAYAILQEKDTPSNAAN